MPNLTFSDEGPQYYGLAYARNLPYAKGGPYFTKLSPQEEQGFRQWLVVSGNPTKFDPDAKITDYDMRGYWKDVASKGKDLSAINPTDRQIHLPDTYKTPYDTTFSGESRYAKPGVPLKWVDAGIPGKERLINTKTGEVMFQKKKLPTPAYPAQLLPDDYMNHYHDLLVQQSQPHMFSSMSPFDRLKQATDAQYDSLEKYSGKDKELRWEALGSASERAFRTLRDQGYEPPMPTVPSPQSVFGGNAK